MKSILTNVDYYLALGQAILAGLVGVAGLLSAHILPYVLGVLAVISAVRGFVKTSPAPVVL